MTDRKLEPNGLHRLVRTWSEPWMANAACAYVDADLWFPEVGGSVRDAKAICAGCPVAALCLEYAVANKERFGIWGGQSEMDRRRTRNATSTEVAA